MLELEKTYLLKYFPQDMEKCPKKEIVDIYIPKTSKHSVLRIRKVGDKFEITKKEPVELNDSSRQTEHTIKLTEPEYKALVKSPGLKLRKIRYYFKNNGKTAEIDVFQDNLKGLVLVDVEFESLDDKDTFEMPDFCLTEVTQEEFIAGGKLCGKKYTDIQNVLKRFNYSKKSLPVKQAKK